MDTIHDKTRRLTTPSLALDAFALAELMRSGNEPLGTQAIEQVEERTAGLAEMVETEIA